MLRVGFAYIWPEKEARLRGWLSELQSRRDEVLESFRQEAARHEQAFIIDGKNGPLLIYVMEADDNEAARDAFRRSKLEIDTEHRAVLKECLRERLQFEPLFDCLLPTAGSTRTQSQ